MAENQLKPDRKIASQADRMDLRLVRLSRVIFILNITLVIVTVIAIIALMMSNDLEIPRSDLVLLTVISAIIMPVNGIVALLIISRYPKHTVGWLLMLLSFNYAVYTLNFFVLLVYENSLADTSSLFVDLFYWMGLWNWIPLLTVQVIFIPLYFPTGRLLSKRWRIVAVPGIVGTIFYIVSNAVNPVIEGDVNPFIFPGGSTLAEILNTVAGPLLAYAIVGAMFSVVMRYRRAEQAERTQMKWIIYIVVLGIALMMLPLDRLTPILPEAIASAWSYLLSVMLFLVAVLVPGAIGVAILRYRLYDIDIIIRRTLIYGAVTLALAAVYFGSVVLLQQLLTGFTGQQSPLAIVISTLVIAALFNPLRRRIQLWIDRRFYRRKYDAAKTLARFAESARNEADLDRLTTELINVVQETMQPEHASLWLKKRT